MTWTPRDRYPDKPERELVFEEEGALAHLLLNGVVFLNNFWYEKEWPEEARKCVQVVAICSDTFAYACADAERVHYEELPDLYRMWRTDPVYGSTAWCVKKRKERPIGRVENALRERGYDVDSWGLRDNTTNAEVQATFAWAAAQSKSK